MIASPFSSFVDAVFGMAEEEEERAEEKGGKADSSNESILWSSQQINLICV